MRKHGIASVHPLRGPELRILRRLQRDYPHSAYVFVSERKGTANRRSGAQSRWPGGK
jgi:type 1 fimbriae regulatory protein FimB/type 1 fimbriae regulatory protein FimE